ncbi:MAG TPA: MCE family protein [Gordonia sp. (in: high G+C Gram-positive bacteria)]|uniref:MCE family protein n=1 Tax=unclassified Gordonia (in: high G+C Gram-positive bacteria) TaxID=2657482 RepID=UPI000FA29589|nr:MULTISPECIES: MCE family protein [unclassified Gordonia (in: high G+C Gram-positive bacteria)]RUP39655.1 MAG: MCE family protein [Gordonia sp. (in: high G+C Gram-positive bacteria)]HNP56923.1 MCE family protein [Gordonia sp. (in: high G+C Gram-positive bacteria)]HRC51174.1 MCE family protein [Gordonia sp. (in: high G+C Gram-positive bacteria)]
MKSIVPPLIKLITFALITVIATAMLALTIANAGSSGKHDFQAVFDDAAMLNKGDDVRIAGVRVGAVSNVEVFERNRAKVSFAVDRATLPDGTNVHIRYRNLTGLRYLALERGAGDAGKVLRPGHVFGLDRGDTTTHPAVNLTQLFDGFRPVFRQLSPEDVNKLADQIISVFQDSPGQNMAATMSSLLSQTSELTNTLADRDQVIGELITNLNKVLETVSAHDEQFDSLLVNTSQLVTGLAAQRGSVGSAVTSVSNLTSVMGSILGQTRPAIAGDIAGLRSVSDQIMSRKKDVEAIITNLPPKLEKIGRAATFGSWFQFYLCGIDVVMGNGKSILLSDPLIPMPDINHVLYTSAATRCWRDERRPG